MDVNRKDVDFADVMLKVFDKLRFDVSGVECVRLADALTWFTELRQRFSRDVDAAEKAAREQAVQARINAAVAAAQPPPPSPAEVPAAEGTTA